jgi:DNA-binding winged helix-turn-helix (wHTH) protein/tetratricopeptide (TPR) repeat protein/TolB-like protein
MASSAPSVTRYCFARFELDIASRSLTRGGNPVAMPPKALDCLIYLIQHRERAVGRDELISAVWGRVDISYAVLGQTLWKLRRALNEVDDSRSEYIRTVPRFGYQWTVPSSGDGDESDPLADVKGAQSPPPPSSGETQRRSALVLAVLVFAAAALTGGVAYQRYRAPSDSVETRQAATPKIRRFLVMPVRLSREDPQYSWIRLGLMDYLASQLRKDDRLQVIGSERVISLLGADASAMGRPEADVTALLLQAGATDLVESTATRAEVGWRVALVRHGLEGAQTFTGVGGSALDAASDAAKNLLLSEGFLPVQSDGERSSLTELTQRMDAETLAGNHSRALAIAKAAPEDQQAEAHVRLKVAQIEFRLGQIDAASNEFHELANKTDGVSDDVRIAAAIGFANTQQRRQRYDDAERGYSQAIAALGERGDPALLSQALSMRGLVNTYLGRSDAGFADFARARIEYLRSGDEVGAASLDANVGLAERARGRHQDAAEAFDRAIAVFDRFGMYDRTANALIGAIGERLALLEIPKAVALSERSKGLSEHVETPIVRTYLALVRGETLLADGRLNELEALLDAAGPEADISDPRAIPDLVLLRISLSMQPGRDSLPASALETALDRIERPTDSAYATSVAAALIVLSEAALRRGDVTLARRFLTHLEQRGAADDRFRALALALIGAEVAAASGDPAADALFESALREADRTTYPDAVVTVCVAWARARAQTGDRELLATIAGRLEPYTQVEFRAARAAETLYTALGEEDLARNARTAAAALAHERDAQAPL